MQTFTANTRFHIHTFLSVQFSSVQCNVNEIYHAFHYSRPHISTNTRTHPLGIRQFDLSSSFFTEIMEEVLVETGVLLVVWCDFLFSFDLDTYVHTDCTRHCRLVCPFLCTNTYSHVTYLSNIWQTQISDSYLS